MAAARRHEKEAVTDPHGDEIRSDVVGEHEQVVDDGLHALAEGHEDGSQDVVRSRGSADLFHRLQDQRGHHGVTAFYGCLQD